MKPNEIAPAPEKTPSPENPEVANKAADTLGLGSLKLADLQTLGRGSAAAANPESAYPSTTAERRQEFVDNFGQLGRLYSDSVNDPDGTRFARFQDRMGSVYGYDRQTMLDMGKLGQEMSERKFSPEKSGQPDNGKPYAEQVGEKIGEILRSTLARHPGDGPSSPSMSLVEGAISGMLLAARDNFDADPVKRAAQDAMMVNAVEATLSKDSASNQVHAVIFGDTKEPGLDIYPPGQKRNRLDYNGT